MSHELTKSLKLKGSFAEFMDGVIDHFGHLLDNTGIRDWVYVLAYLAAVYTAYNAASALADKADSFVTFIEGLADAFVEKVTGSTLSAGVFLGRKVGGESPSTRAPSTPSPKTPKFVVDMNILALALVGGYMVLKIDASDVASAVAKLGPGMAAIMGGV